MEFIVSFKKTPQGHLVVVTDKEIVGKVFRENNFILDLSSPFYKGDILTLEKTKTILRSAYILHLTGKNAVQIGIELNLVDPSNVLLIQRVPHAEVYLG